MQQDDYSYYQQTNLAELWESEEALEGRGT
jgi:hypothetical protein